MILRPYQDEAVRSAYHALLDRGNTLVAAPTGAGKTIMLSALAGKLKGRQMVLQHRKELVDQNQEKFLLVNKGASTSRAESGSRDYSGKTVFGMIQTVTRHVDEIPKIDTLIIDEAHHCTAPTYLRVIDAIKDKNPDVKVAGFSATPARGDGKGLKPVFDHCAYQISINTLIELGFLVKPKPYTEDVGLSDQIDELRQQGKASEFGESQEAADLFMESATMESIIREWSRLAGDRKTVFFCSSIDHAKAVAQALRGNGVKAEALTQSTGSQARADMLYEFEHGDLQCLVNVMVLTEGYDAPPCSCVVLLRLASYKSTMIQMIGRGLRTLDPEKYPGQVKKDCIVLDFGYSLQNHEDLFCPPQFDDKPKDEDAIAPLKECYNCGSAIPIQCRFCPICGAEFVKEDQEEAFKTLTEFDLFDRSPFRWLDLFGSGKVLIASGFNAWAAVVSKDGDIWHGIGQSKLTRTNKHIALGDKTTVLAMADDFMRMNEDGVSARKNKRWLNDPASAKQWELLQMLGYQRDLLGISMSKYSAACHCNFQWNRNVIEQTIGM